MAENLPRDIFRQCALRRLDPGLREVVGFSAFVVIYKFSPGDNQWEKTDFEGTLFVYARSGKPSHKILVLNRLGPDNFVEPICGELIFQRRESFLFYVTPACSLFGIWFRDRGDCQRISYLIDCVKRQLTAAAVADEEWSDIATFKSLMGMSDSPSSSARKASRGKKSGDGKKSDSSKKPERGRSRIAAQLGDGSPGTSAGAKKSDGEEEAAAGAAAGDTTGDDEDQTPKSVVDFFARAGCAPMNPQAGLMHGEDGEGAAVNPIVQQIVTNPYHSLEHVEKQQMMASPQQPTPGGTQRPKAADTQKPKTPDKSKEDGAQKPKEGEGKSSKPDIPSSIVEFLNKLKISRSSNSGREGRVEEIPDLLPLIPDPPLPNLGSIPRTFEPIPFQPVPFMPGHFGPIETFDFVPGPIDSFLSGSSRPLPLFPKPDLRLINLVPPEPPALFPEPPALLPEPQALIPEQPALIQEPLALIPEAPARVPSTPESPVETHDVSEEALLLSQTPEPPPLLPQSPEPRPCFSPATESPASLSPTPDPPMPLSSILKNARLSMQPKPALPKPLSLLPKPPEPSLSSMPTSIFAPINSTVDVQCNDYIGQAGAAVAVNNAGGSGNNDLNDSDGEGVGDADAPPIPLPYTQSNDFNVGTLTRDQLLQAICYLLQNDPSFIEKIHEAYLKSLSEKYP